LRARRGQVCSKFGEKLKLTAKKLTNTEIQGFYFFKMRMRFIRKYNLVKIGVLQEPQTKYNFYYRNNHCKKPKKKPTMT